MSPPGRTTLARTLEAIGRALGHPAEGRGAVPGDAAVPAPADAGKAGKPGSGPDLLAVLAHELRTPLTALLGYSELLAEPGEMDEEQRRAYAQVALTAARHLDELIKAVMGEDGLASPSAVRRPVDLTQLLTECCDLLDLDARRNGLTLHGPDARARVEAVCDPRAVRQIVLNLIGNAIKFTPRGGSITATAGIEGAFAVLSIEDTGVGMSASGASSPGAPSAALPGGGPAGARVAGRGLGLGLVRSLARLHGGDVAIQPADGTGTRVRVTLPRDRTDAQASSNSTTGAAEPGRSDPSSQSGAEFVQVEPGFRSGSLFSRIFSTRPDIRFAGKCSNRMIPCGA